MMSRCSATTRFSSRSVRAAATIAVAAAAALMVTGCGEKKGDKPASQTAAKVNKEEITVHQINFVLQQQRGLAPAQAASASQQVLERLIDQELALQKAQDQKLDRDPAVVQQLEAARREIIARAYVEKIGSGAPKATQAEVKKYFDSHPALFSDRRIYSLQELAIEAKPEQLPEIRRQLAASKAIPEFVDYLKRSDIKFTANQAVRAAEQLPLASLDQFAAMKDGQTVFTVTPVGATVVVLVGSRSQPVDETRATPAIEQYLLNERKRKVVEDDLHALRAAAKVEYVGDYANGGARAMPARVTPPPDAPPLTSVAPPLPAGSAVVAAPQIEVPSTTSASAVMPGRPVLEEGMKGFK